MAVKLSQIADGGAYVASTDKVVAVRNGTTDVLVTPVDTATAQTLSSKTLVSPILSGAAPASAAATGTAGMIRSDANYIYICTATNTWKRVAIATW